MTLPITDFVAELKIVTQLVLVLNHVKILIARQSLGKHIQQIVVKVVKVLKYLRMIKERNIEL